jgi:pimeloyl-ACP methyl ester carboxylesterase
MKRWRAAAWVLAWLLAAGQVCGCDESRAADEPGRPGPPAECREIVPMPTLGGNQLWADELLRHQWRIQRNVVSGHYRLLDGNNLRHAWGTFAQCRAVLDQIQRERNLPPMEGKAVILLHGMADTRAQMHGLGRYLEQKGGYRVFNVTYPSTRQGIAEHAKGLAAVVDHLDGIEEINFVGYSLGNLVIRRYFADQLQGDAGKLDPRFKRMVMIGPPNHGSQLATNLGENKLFELLLGKSGQQLGPLWAWEEGSLATPPFEFGIVAGGCGDDRGFNPLLPGDNDGVVTVASTQLAGATDFIVVHAVHVLLPREPRVHEVILRFLDHGYFVAPDRRTPLGDEGTRGEGRGERGEGKGTKDDG